MTLSTFFKDSYITIESVAYESGINASLLRQYVAGIKTPSDKRLKQIEQGIHNMGRKLKNIRIAYKRHKPN